MESDSSSGIRRWKSLLVVASCTAMNMYAMTSLFPYVGFMVSDFQGVDPDGAGYAAGYVASAFFLGRFATSYFWGYMSDRYGRKPILLMTMTTIAIGSSAFGLSPGFIWAVLTRAFMGLTSAATTVGRAIVPELCGPEGVVEGMAYITGSFAVGRTLGPAVGGVLSQPTKHFPSLFPRGGFFDRYPYLLPNLMGSLGAFMCIPLIIFFVPETKHAEDPCVHPSKGWTDSSVENEEDANNHEASEAETVEVAQPGIFGEGGLLRVRYIPELLVATVLMEGVIVGLDEVYPLWALSSRGAGGLNWDVFTIGQVLFSAGVVQLMNQFATYYWLVKRIGLEACHRGAGIVAAIVHGAIPFIAYLPWSDGSLFIISSVAISLLNCASCVLYTAMMVSSTNPVPPRLRGKLAGIMTASQCLGGAIGPAVFSVMFAWSISEKSSSAGIPFANQHFAFIIGALLRIVVLALVWKVITVEAMTDVVLESPTLDEQNRVLSRDIEIKRQQDDTEVETAPILTEDQRSDLE